MNLLHVIILAVVQGLAELLPISSSAHVIVVGKLLGMPPAHDPKMTLLLVMLHTGTMFAVILYFWKAWRTSLFASWAVFKEQALRLVVATAVTLAVGLPLIKGIEKVVEDAGYVANDANGKPRKAEIEMLFDNLGLVSAALAAAGVLILVAGVKAEKKQREHEIGIRDAAWIGGVQGLCLPFRGFSRSGATISTGMLLGAVKARVEEFSFALGVIITPGVVGREVLRMLKDQREAGHSEITLGMFAPSLLGMFFAFLAGLVALRWLSGWLEGGRWYLFGIYCLAAASAVFVLFLRGY